MYDFLRRPAWIVSHVLIGLLILAMIGLGFWQRQRWIDVRAHADQLERLATGTPVSLDRVVSDSVRPADVPDSVQSRRVKLTGTYDAAFEVAIANRTQNSAPGAWVMTPLILADGTAVAVVRGWVPLDVHPPRPPFPGSEPPKGQVTVTGTVQTTQLRGLFGATDPPTGTLRSLARVDLDRYAKQVAAPLAPVWVLLDEQQPPQPGGADALPQPVQIDPLSPSTNFSYMVQWWIFATIALVGYPLVLRRVARNRARGDGPPEDDLPDDDDAAPDGPGHGEPVSTGV